MKLNFDIAAIEFSGGVRFEQPEFSGGLRW